jgi:hypothetical protein
VYRATAGDPAHPVVAPNSASPVRPTPSGPRASSSPLQSDSASSPAPATATVRVDPVLERSAGAGLLDHGELIGGRLIVNEIANTR